MHINLTLAPVQPLPLLVQMRKRRESLLSSKFNQVSTDERPVAKSSGKVAGLLRLRAWKICGQSPEASVTEK